MAYAYDITITSTHTSTSAAKKYIQPYLHKVFAWTKLINLTLNPDKTTSTLFTADPADWTLKTQRTTELLHSVVCLAFFWIKFLLKCKLLSPTSIFADNYR